MSVADKKIIEVYTSALAIATSYYILSKSESVEIVLRKMQKFKLLCSISEMDNEVVEKALCGEFSDFEDGLQYYSAIASDCDAIITRNEKDFKKAIIPVMNAAAYLNLR